MSPVEYDSPKLELINQALKNHIQTNNFDIKSIVSQAAGESLLGFLGDHIRFKVEYISHGIESQANFFIKSYPKENLHRGAFNDEYKTFEREITIYMKILKQFEESEESEQWHPKCLAVAEDALLFEDLSVRGFKMLEIRNTFNIDQCLVALTSVARLHSAIIILEESESLKRGHTYRLENEFGDILGESAIGYNNWMKTGLETVLEIVEIYGKYKDNLDVIKRGIKKAFKYALGILKPSNMYRNALVHMDLWNNNIMFRHKDDKPVQSMLVDFQASRLLPPAVDVISILNLNLDKKLRDENFDFFLKHYYDEFARKLRKNNIKPEIVFPLREFRTSCELFKIWGPIHSLTLCQFIFLSSEETLKIINDSKLFRELVDEKRTDKLKTLFNADSVLEERYLSCIDELVNEFILKN